MSILKDALTALVPDAQFYEGQYPAPVISCFVPRENFREAGRAMKKAYALLAAEWAADETPFGRGYGIYACFRWGAEYLIVKTEAPANDPVFPSLTKKFVPAYRFERQIESLMGITPAGHPDSRPWIKFEDWPADAWPLREIF